MGKASRSKREKNQARRGLSTADVQTIPGHCRTAANDEWLDDVLTEKDEILMEELTSAVFRDDAHAVAKLLPLLSLQKLEMNAISFRDFETDCVYSILGLARQLSSWNVCSLMTALGMTQDYIDDEGIFDWPATKTSN
jgi:hypothetical protein